MVLVAVCITHTTHGSMAAGPGAARRCVPGLPTWPRCCGHADLPRTRREEAWRAGRHGAGREQATRQGGYSPVVPQVAAGGRCRGTSSIIKPGMAISQLAGAQLYNSDLLFISKKFFLLLVLLMSHLLYSSPPHIHQYDPPLYNL